MLAAVPEGWKWLIGILGALLILRLFAAMSHKHHPALRAKITPAETIAKPETVVNLGLAIQPGPAVKVEPEPPAGPQWVYKEDEDKLGRKRSSASLKSSNEFEFKFPYAGAQSATLAISRSVQSGIKVVLSIERGQFMHHLTGCDLHVRFDQGVIELYHANEPHDRSTTTLFLANESKFIGSLLQAKTVLIEAVVYQEGPHIFEFNVAGFKGLKLE
jgi:hypothetical protein